MNATFIDDLIKKHCVAKPSSKKFFIQVGAGAGDLDPLVNYRDGFTEHIKRADLPQTSRILLVEPNPLNIPSLRCCWAGYSNVEIHQLGIVPRSLAGQRLNFHFADCDAPHYQVGSFRPSHVLKHFTQISQNDLRSIDVETIDLNSFMKKCGHDGHIVLLALDIEGLDVEILLDTDFSAFKPSLVSFEHLHIGEHYQEVHEHLRGSGYEFVGTGIDHSGFDLLYEHSESDL